MTTNHSASTSRMERDSQTERISDDAREMEKEGVNEEWEARMKLKSSVVILLIPSHSHSIVS